MGNRNKKYEEKKRSEGFVKKTVWIPVECEIEIMQMIEFCSANKAYIPFMARNTKTGKMKKAV